MSNIDLLETILSLLHATGNSDENLLEQAVYSTLQDYSKNTPQNPNYSAPAKPLDSFSSSKWRNMFLRLSEEFPQHAIWKNLISTDVSTIDSQCNSEVLDQFDEAILKINTLMSKCLNSSWEFSEYFSKLVMYVCESTFRFLYTELLLVQGESIMSEKNESHHLFALFRFELEFEAYERLPDIFPIILLINKYHLIEEVANCNADMNIQQMSPRSIISKLLLILQESQNLSNELKGFFRHPIILENIIKSLFESTSDQDDFMDSDIILIHILVSTFDSDHQSIDGIENQKIQTRNLVRFLKKTDAFSLVELTENREFLLESVRSFSGALLFIVTLQQNLTAIMESFSAWTIRNTLYYIISEILLHHPQISAKVFDLLKVFVSSPMGDHDPYEDLEAKTSWVYCMIDCMIHGLSEPVFEFVREIFENSLVDGSIVRTFVTNVIQTFKPPFSPEFLSKLCQLANQPQIFQHLQRSEREIIKSLS